jgi:protein TonB
MRRRREEGRVVVRARIAPDGAVTEASVAASSGAEDLDRAALAAVRRARYAPAQRGGFAVASSVEVPITFRLAD